MKFFEAWAGMVVFLLACWVWFFVCHYSARVFFPNSAKAESIAFKVAILGMFVGFILIGGSPGDSSDRWLRR